MALPPIFSASLQSAVLSATSNLMAQAITAYRTDTPLVIDWVPVFQFVIFTLVITPPNFMWQSFLEETFPAYYAAPTDAAVVSAANQDGDKALDAEEAKTGSLVEPKLNIRNTIIKTILDQTVGAAFNTFGFSMFMHSIQAAMADAPRQTPLFLSHPSAIDYARVDWRLVVARSQADFWPIVMAGWRLWPFVSIINFAFVKTIPTRNLIGSLAGVVWGIYMSLVAAR